MRALLLPLVCLLLLDDAAAQNKLIRRMKGRKRRLHADGAYCQPQGWTGQGTCNDGLKCLCVNSHHSHRQLDTVEASNTAAPATEGRRLFGGPSAGGGGYSGSTYNGVQDVICTCETAPPPPMPPPSYPPPPPAQLVCGGNHCGAAIQGQFKMWGRGGNGELGYGSTSNKYTPYPVSVGGTVSILMLFWHATCVYLEDIGQTKCWGQNNYGQLGDGTSSQRNYPVTCNLGGSVITMAAGAYHACASLEGGLFKCWGYNSHGELGDTTSSHRYTPVVVNIGGTVISIGMGHHHSCAALDNGLVKCTGRNNEGALGVGHTSTRYEWTTVQGITTGVLPYGFGQNGLKDGPGGYHMCAQEVGTESSPGQFKCWGHNNYGQLGDGTSSNRNSPVVVNVGGTVIQSCMGFYFTCVRLTGGNVEGTVKCFGRNNNHQMADGTTSTRYVPQTVNVGCQAALLTCAGYSISVYCTDGRIRSWAYNSHGELGDGSSSQRNTPVNTNY